MIWLLFKRARGQRPSAIDANAVRTLIEAIVRLLHSLHVFTPSPSRVERCAVSIRARTHVYRGEAERFSASRSSATGIRVLVNEALVAMNIWFH